MTTEETICWWKAEMWMKALGGKLLSGSWAYILLSKWFSQPQESTFTPIPKSKMIKVRFWYTFLQYIETHAILQLFETQVFPTSYSSDVFYTRSYSPELVIIFNLNSQILILILDPSSHKMCPKLWNAETNPVTLPYLFHLHMTAALLCFRLCTRAALHLLWPGQH